MVEITMTAFQATTYLLMGLLVLLQIGRLMMTEFDLDGVIIIMLAVSIVISQMHISKLKQRVSQ